MDNLKEQIAVGSFWNFLMVLVARIGGLIFTILLARFLQPQNFGIYNLALSIALILLVSIDTGINQSILRYVSEAIGKGEKKRAAADYKYLFRLKMMITIGISLSLLVLAYPLSMYVFKKPLLFLPLLLSSLYVLAYSLGSFYEYFFYAIEKVKFITVKQFLFEISRITGILLMFYFLDRSKYVIGTITILIIAIVLSGLFLLINMRTVSPYIFERNNETVDKKRIFRFFISLGTIGSLLVLFGYIDILMIGIFLEAEYVGFYSAVYALTAGLWSFLNISNVMLPIMTKLKKADLENSTNKLIKYLLVLSVPAAFGILILGSYFIELIYGAQYLPGALSFYILSVMIIEVPLISLITSIFSAREKPKFVIRIIIITTFLNIILNYILIKLLLNISPTLAIAGAALATVISHLFYLIGLIIFAKRELNMHLKISYLLKPLAASIIMGSVLYLINLKIELNFAYAVLEIVLGITIYFLAMVLIKGIEKNDFRILKNVIRNFSSKHFLTSHKQN